MILPKTLLVVVEVVEFWVIEVVEIVVVVEVPAIVVVEIVEVPAIEVAEVGEVPVIDVEVIRHWVFPLFDQYCSIQRSRVCVYSVAKIVAQSSTTFRFTEVWNVDFLELSEYGERRE